MNNKYFRIAQFIISSICLIYVLRGVKPGNILSVFQDSNFLLIFLVTICTSIGIIISSYKLKLLLDFSDLLGLVKLTYISVYFNLFLPGSISSDIIKIGFLKKNNISSSKSTAAVLMDRGTGLFALLFYISIGIIINKNIPLDIQLYTLNNYTLLLVLLLCVVVSIFIKKIKIVNKFLIETFYNVTCLVKDNKKIMMQIVTLALLFQLLSPLMFYLELYAFMGPNEVPFTLLLFLIGLTNIISVIPISVQGIGVKESILLAFLRSYGVTNEIIISISLVSYILLLLNGIIGFYTYNKSPEVFQVSTTNS